MPTKLKVLVGVMMASVVLSVVMQSWIAAVFQIFLVGGVLKGSEGARTWLILVGYAGIAAYLFLLALAGIVVFGGGVPLSALPPAALAPLAVGTLDIGKCVFFIWCLKRPDVQQWMFSRSVAGLDLAV